MNPLYARGRRLKGSKNGRGGGTTARGNRSTGTSKSGGHAASRGGHTASTRGRQAGDDGETENNSSRAELGAVGNPGDSGELEGDLPDNNGSIIGLKVGCGGNTVNRNSRGGLRSGRGGNIKNSRAELGAVGNPGDSGELEGDLPDNNGSIIGLKVGCGGNTVNRNSRGGLRSGRGGNIKNSRAGLGAVGNSGDSGELEGDLPDNNGSIIGLEVGCGGNTVNRNSRGGFRSDRGGSALNYGRRGGLGTVRGVMSSRDGEHEDDLHNDYRSTSGHKVGCRENIGNRVIITRSSADQQKIKKLQNYNKQLTKNLKKMMNKEKARANSQPETTYFTQQQQPTLDLHSLPLHQLIAQSQQQAIAQSQQQVIPPSYPGIPVQSYGFLPSTFPGMLMGYTAPPVFQQPSSQFQQPADYQQVQAALQILQTHLPAAKINFNLH